ncbi:uncharacterized protein DEA37_0000463 [Paragonimus westermani]|uniref:PH domain-containing protein n=1 Tax=Paragonimus westermani TaxID=34504 RepID=A0A5J4NTQ7_9TREM|nr:uncharacterized protein DEA37_0000463 [Paragonimus westermani]
MIAKFQQKLQKLQLSIISTSYLFSSVFPLFAPAAADCLQYMRNGSALTKLRTSGRQYKRTFYLDDQLRCIRWVSSNKRHARAQIHITEIHDVQLGCSTRSAHSLNRRRQLSLTPVSANLPAGGCGNTLQFNYSTSRSPTTLHRHTLTTSATSSPVLPLGQANAARLNLTSSTFTITYGPDFDALELLANSPEEADIWVTGIKCLMTGAQGKVELQTNF